MNSYSEDFTDNVDPSTSSKVISSSTDFAMPDADSLAHKRPLDVKDNGEPPKKRPTPSIRVGTGFKWNLQALAKAADAVETGGKSPVSALNELGLKVTYNILRQRGPPHCPSFNVSVTVADLTFEGWGHSKREARACAARACLTALLARAGRVLGGPNPPDFTKDEPNDRPIGFQCGDAIFPPVQQDPSSTVSPRPKSSAQAPSLFSSTPSPFTPTPSPFTPTPSPFNPTPSPFTPTQPLFTSAPPMSKSAINTLYETYPGVMFNYTYGDGSSLESGQAPLQLAHSMRFKVVCVIKDQKFEGYGSSKKLAKLAASKCALGVLREQMGITTWPPCVKLPQTLADHVSKLVNEKFNELMRNDLAHSKRKVLAGIVITINNRPQDAKVIAVTTGTKCISGEHMSVRGIVVNDCHAEVASRRCLQRYLYSELLKYAKARDPRKPIPDSDLEPLPDGGYRLRMDRQVHLYVSTAPCGDGRIFSPHDIPEVDKHPNRTARGQLRTKIESGEGTIPVKSCSSIQTWDGVLQGERLLTMSCSDKVARWCVSGLQGALLSRVLAPVYLTSIVLGSLLHHQHMYRAVCGRIESCIGSIPPPFKMERPMLARAASAEVRQPTRAPTYCVSWCRTQPFPEIINAMTGKQENGQPSLICKQSMYARWQYLVKKLPLIKQATNADIEEPPIPENVEALLYSEAKQLCTTYQKAKERLIEAFDKAGLGRWIKKPMEQDLFPCELMGADPTALFV